MTEEPWGVELAIDIHDCDPEKIRSADEIKRFVRELVELIDMKTFGECQVVHFGEDDKVAGYSMVQLISTSLISGHWSNSTNAAYINIFSCKEYDVDAAAKFATEFFGGFEFQRVVNNRPIGTRRSS